MPLNILIPQSIYLESHCERLITADVLRIDNSVYLFMMSDYPDTVIDIDRIVLKGPDGLIVTGRIEVSSHLEALHTMSGVNVLAFDLPPDYDRYFMNVYLADVYIGRISLCNSKLKSKASLTAATLFKNDYATLRAWVEYHSLLGFDRFVLYYNGYLGDILHQITAFPTILEKDIVLVQWPYSYWLDCHPENKIQHHAQVLMLSHALMYLKETTEYLSFIDLDEYFVLPFNSNIFEFVQKLQKDVYVFQSRWAETTKIPSLDDGCDFFCNEKVEVDKVWLEFPHRTKFIANPKAIITTNMHFPYRIIPNAEMVTVNASSGGIYHFYWLLAVLRG